MSEYDVVVIGAGPGGYPAAIRCSQHGLKTAVVEKNLLGGVCLNVGCIPSKALIHASHFFKSLENASKMGIFVESQEVDFGKLQLWKESICDQMRQGVLSLLKANKVDVIKGKASFVNSQEIVISDRRIKAKHFIIATGSSPCTIPGFEYDENLILSSTGALNQKTPIKKLIVIGGGYIGLEIGCYMAKLGTKVVVLEASDNLFSGLVDDDVCKEILKRFKTLGVDIHTNSKALSVDKKVSSVEVSADIEGSNLLLKADKVLVTVGRVSNSAWIKNLNLDLDESGFIKTDPQMRTSVSNIFAVGDVAKNPMLAHKASYEGLLAADVIAKKNRVFDAKVIPAVIFTDPEIATVGLSEKELGNKADYKISKFPYKANARAVSVMEDYGFVKIISQKNTGLVVGVQIVGFDASNLIGEACLAIEMGASLEDIALTIHPHPTLSEMIMETSELGLGHPVHIFQRQ